MRVRFWGTRGSLATAGPGTLRYGGNTSCVEVRSAAGTLIVLDCGTGSHGLGQTLLAAGSHPVHGHLLISHTHWDHIQGLPFFAPLFVPGNQWAIYGPQGLGLSLRPGTICGLLGVNGAGKSTLLKLVAGLLFAESGTVQALGRNPFMIIVPCHRVLEAGNYADRMAPNGGVISKRRLLTIEGARPTVSKTLFDVLLPPVAPPRPHGS